MKLPPLTVACPCGVEIDVPIVAELVTHDDRRQTMKFDPDYSDLWAHAWTHDETVDFQFEDPS